MIRVTVLSSLQSKLVGNGVKRWRQDWNGDVEMTIIIILKNTEGCSEWRLEDGTECRRLQVFPPIKLAENGVWGRQRLRCRGYGICTDETMFACKRLRRRGKTQNLLPIL